MAGTYTKAAFAGVVIFLTLCSNTRRMKSSLAHEYDNFWEKILRIIKDDIMFYGSGGSFELRF